MRDEFGFLAHYLDPFKVQPPALWFISDSQSAKPVTFDDLSGKEETVITYDTHRLIAAFRQNNLCPPTLIDIRDALKLLSGLSKDQGGESHWNTFVALSVSCRDNKPRILEELLLGKIPQLSTADTNALIEYTAKALASTWVDLISALKLRGEWRRFEEIEIPIQRLFRRREYLGIPIDLKKRNQTLQQTRVEKYVEYRELGHQLGYAPTSLTYSNVGGHLAQTDAAYLLDFAESPSFEQYFEVARQQSKFADAFVRYCDARKDESTLVRMGIEPNRVYPAFECFGTVTGRIMLNSPALQSLKKRHRSMIIAEPGKELLYFDYSQFEPGVMAGLAGDETFLAFYNSGDIYRDLAIALFNDSTRRSEAKQVFLGYLYGMSEGALGKMLAGASNADGEHHAVAAISRFFERFPGIREYRRSAQNELQEVGYVGSLLGNRRIRTHTGRLVAKEQNWALSQRIQGTASLIYKDALIRVGAAVGSDNIVLPMHDAILIQCTELEVDLYRELVSKAMIDTFNAWLPGVHPRVATEFTFSQGAEEEIHSV